MNRIVSAEIWDGRTKYDVQETEEQKKQRLLKWEKFLEEGDGNKADDTTKVDSKSETGKNTNNTKSDEKDLKKEDSTMEVDKSENTETNKEKT